MTTAKVSLPLSGIPGGGAACGLATAWGLGLGLGLALGAGLGALLKPRSGVRELATGWRLGTTV